MVTIRAAVIADAPALADLAGELGYPASRQQIAMRFREIEATNAACVLVAEDEGRVVGWAHVAQAAHLTDEADAELLGLVVAGSARGGGFGAALLRAAEDWARGRGLQRMRLHSRVERERAHRFYERAGYLRIKTQALFRKPLD